MKGYPLVIAAALYVAVAAGTFGHCAAHHPAKPYVYQGILISKNTDITVLGSIIAGVAWPLYWSWELQS